MAQQAPLPRWRKSSRSGSQSNCVEVAGTLDAVRDSKHPAGPVVNVSPTAFEAFLAAVRRGKYDV
ncbi:MAG: DUF397 domain-containing protein [Saccharothrix sp.]|nr:DUF397 domain-containing protein [Saccharothrix sp.]